MATYAPLGPAGLFGFGSSAGVILSEVIHNINIFWILFCAALVFTMQFGFLCLETGVTGTKNTVNVAMKNAASMLVAIIGY